MSDCLDLERPLPPFGLLLLRSSSRDSQSRFFPDFTVIGLSRGLPFRDEARLEFGVLLTWFFFLPALATTQNMNILSQTLETTDRKAWNQFHRDMEILKLSTYLGAAWFCLWWWSQYTADTAISLVEPFWGVVQHSPDDRPGGRCHSTPTSPQCYRLHTHCHSQLPPPPPILRPALPHCKQKIIGIRTLNNKSSSKLFTRKSV